MADFVEKVIDQPPPMLEKVFRCRHWGVLPLDGGIDDQPLYLLQMEAAEKVYEAYVKHKSMKSEFDFAEKFPELAALYLEIEELRDA